MIKIRKSKLLPSARHERRVGAFLVRAAWERRPEGPAYLLSIVMLLYLAGQCAFFCTRSPPWISGTRRGFFPSSYDSGPVSPDCLQLRERSSGPELVARKSIFLLLLWRYPSSPSPASKTSMFLGVAGGTIERSCYSPHYVNTERDYERDYQATLPQGRTAADGCKPRHGRDDRKRERSFSGLSAKPLP